MQPATQMAPMTVTAGPLGSVGVRCAADVGLFGFVSDSAHLKGLAIVEVLKRSAAEQAGLQAQNRVTKIDGVPITMYTIRDLKRIGEKQKGDAMVFEVLSAASSAPHAVLVKPGPMKKASG
jgi:C-terminal processing protease CtpA/Prc